MDKLTAKVLSTMNEMLSVDNRCPEFDELDKIAQHLGANLCSGATRWAFVFPCYKVVFKFPKWDETDDDYCELELRNYNLGKKYGIERCLLPIEKVGETDSGIPVYVQPMYTTSHEDLPYGVRRRWERKLHGLHQAEIIRKIENGCHYCPTRLWVERATQIYGKAFMKSFQKWSKEGRVNDLHSSNIGYLRKQPIIIDYAGYHG